MHREYCQNQGISIIAHSSLTKGIQLNNQQLLEIINSDKLTSSGLLLKWALQNNLKIIPRSSNHKHILANFNLSSELLSEQIMKYLDNLDCGFATLDGALVHINAIHRRSVEFDANQHS